MLTEADVKQAMTDSGVTTDVSNLGSEQAFSEYGLDSLDLLIYLLNLKVRLALLSQMKISIS